MTDQPPERKRGRPPKYQLAEEARLRAAERGGASVEYLDPFETEFNDWWSHVDPTTGSYLIALSAWAECRNRFHENEQRLRAELAQARANHQAAEADALEWAQLADRQRVELGQLRAVNQALRGVVERLLQWDHFDGAADGPFWRTQLAVALDGQAQLPEAQPKEP